MARMNKRGLELSFKRVGKGQTRGRWLTRIGGQPLYFGYGNGVSDRESYDAALTQFRIWEGKQAEQLELKRRGMTVEQASYEQIMQAYGRQLEEMKKKSTADREGKREAVKVGVLLDEFLEAQKQRNHARKYAEQRREAGEEVHEASKQNLSTYRLVSIKRDLLLFRGCVGDDYWDQTEMAAAVLLKKWRDHCESLLFAKTIAVATFNDRVKLGRMFVGWCDENYKLDRLPRALRKLVAKYEYKPTAKAIPVETIKKLWKHADDRERVFIALGLNCGYYAKDISDLTAAMIDGDYIGHRRGKTGVQVRYKMWAVTKALLKKTRSDTGAGRCFASASGKPLVWFPDGSDSRVDIVRNDFFRLCGRVKVTGFSFSNLRDTSTTAVENFDRTLSDLFDCHTDKRMARFYIDGEMVDSSALDKGIDHLEQFYGLDLSPKVEIPRNKGGRPKKCVVAVGNP